MKVHHVMSMEVYSVSPKTPLRELWKAIFKKNFHGIPVVDAKKKLVGIVAEEDLLKPLYPNYAEYIEDFATSADFEKMEKKINELSRLTAADVMNSRVIFTRSDTPIMRALSRMLVRKVRQLPVLSEKDELIGMVTKGDIFDSLVKRHLMREEQPALKASPVAAKKKKKKKK